MCLKQFNIQLNEGFFVNTAVTTITPEASTPLSQSLNMSLTESLTGSLSGSLNGPLDTLKQLLSKPLNKSSGLSTSHAAAIDMIQTQYQKHFSCQLQHRLPYSLSQLDDEQNQILACTGYQPASEGALFLEQYLDERVEESLQRRTNEYVSREEIVEIGGFAVGHKRHALPSMLLLAPTLADLGFKTVVCTVTRPMQSCLRKLGIVSTLVADADPARVDTSNNAWGTYYDLKPVVLAGDINSNIDKIRPLMSLLAGGS
ncbi:MAG: hypothetical protein ACI9R8_002111 [Candidatus Paceibacteria bacterium]